MNMGNPTFKTIAYGSTEYEKALILRCEILQKSMDCQKEEEINLIHVAGFIEKDVCASAALVPEVDALRMQRVVVRKSLQRQGIGTSLLLHCESYAKNHSFNLIYCFSRIEVIPFYLKNGYIICGSITYKDNKPYQKMQKLIDVD